MQTDHQPPTYHLWQSDNLACGPMELPDLVDTLHHHRLGPDTWIFTDQKKQWSTAGQLPELRTLFQHHSPASPSASRTASDRAEPPGVKGSALRRLKLFAEMTDDEIDIFRQAAEVHRFKQFNHVVRSGEPGDALYLILDGELRARVVIDEKETTLTTMSTGDFFGEVSLLDSGPRSADVLANKDSVVLKISAAAFEKLIREHPQVAAPFMYSLARSVVGRLRNLTKRYQDTVHFARVGRSVHSGPP